MVPVPPQAQGNNFQQRWRAQAGVICKFPPFIPAINGFSFVNMTTLNQLIRKTTIRKKKLHRKRTTALQGNPQRKAICTAINREKPKKPNSALRKVLKVFCLIYETKSLNKGQKKKKVSKATSANPALRYKQSISNKGQSRSTMTMVTSGHHSSNNIDDASRDIRGPMTTTPISPIKEKYPLGNPLSASRLAKPKRIIGNPRSANNSQSAGTKVIKKKNKKRPSKKIKYKIGIKKKARIHAPGEMPLNHFAKFQRLLMRGCRVRDLPGVRYRVILGKLDIKAYYGPIVRKRKRSKYSLKRTK